MNPAESFSEKSAEQAAINCAQACVNGCILGEQCPNQEYRDQTAKFIQETPLDQMLAMAEEAIRKKRSAPPQWVYPDEEG
ncbi:MAG: hypothetical protein KME07_22435 [Pegethrix bostrychoides GSE-TBD4-15B]|uniref:Uncharacterized protein n=1 Tax=Pegethrix bostrychoides GSE-TBD4-15B TaxID=2839662 RepID=A0A951U6R3_9CYAN|nr:hypothetical protein [Pegethrix bostrychoides GSE-TBD4-15B]